MIEQIKNRNKKLQQQQQQQEENDDDQKDEQRNANDNSIKKKILTLRFKKKPSNESDKSKGQELDISTPTLKFSTTEDRSSSVAPTPTPSPSPSPTFMTPITLSPSGTPPHANNSHLGSMVSSPNTSEYYSFPSTPEATSNPPSGTSTPVISSERPPIPRRATGAPPVVPPRSNTSTPPSSFSPQPSSSPSPHILKPHAVNPQQQHMKQAPAPPSQSLKPTSLSSNNNNNTPSSSLPTNTGTSNDKRMVNLRPVSPPFINTNNNSNSNSSTTQPPFSQRPASQPPSQNPPQVPPRGRIKSDIYNNNNNNNINNNNNLTLNNNSTPVNSTSPVITSTFHTNGGRPISLNVQLPSSDGSNSNRNITTSSGSDSSDDGRRKTIRQQLLMRKTASLSLRDDDTLTDESYYDDEDLEYGSSNDILSSTPSTSSSSGSLVDSTNTNGDNDSNVSPPTSSTISNVIQQKKRGFFSSKRGTSNMADVIDQKELIMEKLINTELPASRRSTLPPINNSTATNKVVKELIETEADYLDDLYILINYYKNTILELSAQNIVQFKNEEINCVFSNVDELYVINLRLFNSLLEVIPTLECANQYPIVDDIFFKHTNSLQRYVTYLSNQEHCNKLLLSWENNSQISQVLSQIKSIQGVKNQNISSYVIKPVQRLCKYPLLLRELKNTVPEENEHYRAFERAAKLMEKIVSDINGKIKNEEKLSEIRDIIGKEHDSLLLKKTLLKEGKSKEIKKESGKSQDATLYLFDDIIIVYKATLLSKNRVFSIYLSNILDIKPIETKEIKSGFEILYLHKEQAYRKSFSADNYADKLLWIRDIEDAVHAYKVITENWQPNSY